MKKIIEFAINLMEKENMYSGNPEDLPSQNPDINPSQNPDINVTQNPEINDTQNPKLAPSQNPNWKQAWWETFKELIIWNHLNEDQKEKCKRFLKNL